MAVDFSKMDSLLLKLPKGKLPFIGVLFRQKPAFNKMNEDLVLNHPYAEYRIVCEVIRGEHINLKLICEELLIVRQYSHLRYNRDELNNWLYLTKGAMEFNFSHVGIMNENGKEREVVLRTESKSKPFVLKIKTVDVLAMKEKSY